MGVLNSCNSLLITFLYYSLNTDFDGEGNPKAFFFHYLLIGSD